MIKKYLLLTAVVIFAACLQAQKSGSIQNDPDWETKRYGAWGGPGVSSKAGPMDAILLKDYAPTSSVKSQVTVVEKAKYPAIDMHAHTLARTPAEVSEWVKTMDEVGIEKSIVLTGVTGQEFDELVELYLKSYPDRFILFCGLEKKDIDKPDYAARAAAELERCFKSGARGVGELSDKGFGFTGDTKLPRNMRLHPDDQRLDAFWVKCAELKMPVNIHVADHPSCWQPLGIYQERTPAYQHFNQYGKDIPSYEELLESLNRTLEKHPSTIFIACHLSNQGNDLATLSSRLDRYPNLYLDISARDYEVGRTPRAAAKFLSDYPKRVVFGTDMGREKSMYQAWWRLFETEDEYMTGRVWWMYYGLGLTPKSLKALYRNNAIKLMNL